MGGIDLSSWAVYGGIKGARFRSRDAILCWLHRSFSGYLSRTPEELAARLSDCLQFRTHLRSVRQKVI